MRESSMSHTGKLIELAQALVEEWPGFFEKKGHGAGDKDTKEYMDELQRRALAAFGQDYSQQMICGDTRHSVDFHFPEDQTIVEIAMGLRNPNCEYELDILKAVLAQDVGHDIKRLLYLTKPGGLRKCEAPGRSAIANWLFRHHEIRIEIVEFSPAAELIQDSDEEDES
jgi:hypothetical protein